MPEIFTLASVGGTHLVPAKPYDQDRRGLLYVWEFPIASEAYVLGVDPTVGITGWTRELRVQNDVKIDNAAIEVIRKGRKNAPDVQVAEFAAPIDVYDLARVVNFIGRMYGGNSADGTALACIEVYPGPGFATQRDLINRFGYDNVPPWLYEDKLLSRPSGRFGWYSSKNTRRDLWINGMRHINSKGVVLNSPALIEEMTDCTWDNFLSMTAAGIYGSHDDRVVATLIALWYAHEWGTEWNPPEADKLSVIGPEAQSSDLSIEEMESAWNERFDSLQGG